MHWPKLREVDLEYVSEHYKPGQIAAKRAAGFTLYTENGRSGRSAHGPDFDYGHSPMSIKDEKLRALRAWRYTDAPFASRNPGSARRTRLAL